MDKKKRRRIYLRQHYFLLVLCAIFCALIIAQTIHIGAMRSDYEARVQAAYAAQELNSVEISAMPTVATPLPILMATPTPIPSLGDDPEDEYTGTILNAVIGTVNGPSGKETYYNLPMEYVVELMRDMGYSLEDYPYWIREDGCKMFGPYIMCAADLSIRPKGTIVRSSLGDCMVVDTGYFIYTNPMQIDIAVNW